MWSTRPPQPQKKCSQNGSKRDRNGMLILVSSSVCHGGNWRWPWAESHCIVKQTLPQSTSRSAHDRCCAGSSMGELARSPVHLGETAYCSDAGRRAPFVLQRGRIAADLVAYAADAQQTEPIHRCAILLHSILEADSAVRKARLGCVYDKHPSGQENACLCVKLHGLGNWRYTHSSECVPS